MDSFTNSILAMPDPLKWGLAILGVMLGLPMILVPDRIVRGLRRLMLFQLRLVRRPGYRRMLKIYGWLLLVTGAMLMILLVLAPHR